MDKILSDQYITSLIEEHIKMLYENDKNKDLEDFYRRLDNCINYMKDKYPVKTTIQKYPQLPKVVYQFQKMTGVIDDNDKLIVSRCINFVNIWKDTNDILGNLICYYDENYINYSEYKFLRYYGSNKGITILFALFGDDDHPIHTKTECVIVKKEIILSNDNDEIRDYIIIKRCKKIKDDIDLRRKNTNNKDLIKFFDKTMETMQYILDKYDISMDELEG